MCNTTREMDDIIPVLVISSLPCQLFHVDDTSCACAAAPGTAAVQRGEEPCLSVISVRCSDDISWREQLVYLGREYPDPSYRFNDRLHRCFAAHSGIDDPEKLQQAIAKAEFIKKELETLYFLKKARFATSWWFLRQAS
jgi:hypothetical protein